MLIRTTFINNLQEIKIERNEDRNIEKKKLFPKNFVTVSIIVPTYNSAKTLEKCLQSIVNQTYKNIDLILVDNYSKDDTITIAKKFDARIFFKDGGPAKQRNYGSRMINGQYILFLDSDEEISSDFIDCCLEECKTNTADAIAACMIDHGNSYWAKCKTVGHLAILSERNKKNSKIKYRKESLENLLPNEFVRFCKKNVFFEVNGYNEKLLLGEDLDFSLRLINNNFRVFGLHPIIKHNVPDSLNVMFYKKYHYGKFLTRLQHEFSQSISHRNASTLKLYSKSLLRTHNIKYLPGFLIGKFIESLGLTLGKVISIIKKDNSFN